MYVNTVTQKVMLISCWVEVYEWKKLIVHNPFISTSFFYLLNTTVCLLHTAIESTASVKLQHPAWTEFLYL